MMSTAEGLNPVVLQSGSDLLEIPAQLVLFLLPVLAYSLIRRRRGAAWEDTRTRIGWRIRGVSRTDLGLAVLVAIVTIIIGTAIMWATPEHVLDDIGDADIEGIHLTFEAYLDWEITLAAIGIILFREAIYVTLGEELLFRGLIAGILFRRFGFQVGNLLQTAVFVLPHLIIPLLVPGLWPMIVVWAVSGWLLGWLYYRTGSIVPGWIAHTLGNTFGIMTLILTFF